MRTLGNILWHIPFLGFLSAFATFVIGGLLVVTIVGAPIGFGLIQLPKFLLTPFSSVMVDKKNIKSNQNRLWLAYGFIVRIIYFPIGLVLAIVNAFQVVGLFFSIVGIPVAIVLAKSLGTYFNPVNKVCVSNAVSNEVVLRKAKERIV